MCVFFVPFFDSVFCPCSAREQPKKKAATTKAKTSTLEATGKKAKKTPAKKAKPKADGAKKKTKKKGEEDEKEDPMSGRRKLTMDDLAAAEKGVALVRCGNIRVRKLKN